MYLFVTSVFVSNCLKQDEWTKVDNFFCVRLQLKNLFEPQNAKMWPLIQQSLLGGGPLALNVQNLIAHIRLFKALEHPTFADMIVPNTDAQV